MKQPVKIGYYLSHPIQYFSPLFRKMAEEMDLKVYYYSDVSIKGELDKGFGTEVQWDIPLLNGYESEFLRNWSGKRSMDNGFGDAFNPGVLRSLSKGKAKVVVVNGWSYASNWLVIIASKLMGKKVWLRAESPLNQEMKKSKRTLFLKKILLGKFLFKLFIDKCLYIGTESRKFFEYYGVSPGHLLYTPYAVDNDYFRNAFSDKTVSELKQKLSIPIEKKIVLFTGKFIDKKKPLDLLKAFNKLNNENYLLIMVGEGELRSEMESFIARNGMKNVTITGFINQTQIPAYYKISDVFVMCSGIGETWGLSVNEAMNFNKPVLVSATCGCHADLVKDGVNGFVFPEGDTDTLAVQLKEILENDQLRAKMGEASGAIVKEFSLERIVQNMKADLQKS